MADIEEIKDESATNHDFRLGQHVTNTELKAAGVIKSMEIKKDKVLILVKYVSSIFIIEFFIECFVCFSDALFIISVIQLFKMVI